MRKNLVSIIMPTYNCGQFITESILSVQQQTYKDWELIIVDDCSQDNTEEVLQKFEQDSRIQYIKLDQNGGPAVARNTGIEKADGEYIAFLDSDDLWTSNKLEKQLTFMQANDYNFTCTSYDQIDEKGQFLDRIIQSKKQLNYNKLLLNNYVGNSTVIYNCKNLGKITAPVIRKRNDYALWLKILKREPYVYGLDEVLAHYRVRENSVSSNKKALVKYQYELYRKIEKLSFLKSVYLVARISVMKILKLK